MDFCNSRLLWCQYCYLVSSSWFDFEPIFIVFQEEDYDVPEELEDIIGWSTISFSQQKLILKTFYWIQQRWKTFASCESVKIEIHMFNRIWLQ